MVDALLYENENFVLFGTQHLLTILFSFLLGLSLILLGRRSSEARKQSILHVVGCIISATVVLWTFLCYYSGQFNYKEDLPILICNLMALLVPFYTARPNLRMFEIGYFWILGWTFLAIVTPDLSHGIPHYDYWKFFIVHIGLVFVVIYSIFVFNYRPQWRSVWRAYAAMFPYFLFVIICNWMLKANYFYINHKPENETAIDIFGDWPSYVIWILVILPFYFMMLYVPYFLKDRFSSSS